MFRRRVLVAGGAIVTTLLAGCSSDDPEFEEGSSDDDDPASSADSDVGDDAEANGVPAEESIEAGVDIVEHDLVVEEDEFFEQVSIEGIVENNTEELLNYVEVTARIFDENGHQLDSYIDNTSDLRAGGSWSFEIRVLEDSADIDSYDIAVEDLSW